VFSVKMVARPDARMVEVPLEIQAELPRDFEGAALLSSSGLPRKVRLKAQRDALSLDGLSRGPAAGRSGEDGPAWIADRRREGAGRRAELRPLGARAAGRTGPC